MIGSNGQSQNNDTNNINSTPNPISNGLENSVPLTPDDGGMTTVNQENVNPTNINPGLETPVNGPQNLGFQEDITKTSVMLRPVDPAAYNNGVGNINQEVKEKKGKSKKILLILILILVLAVGGFVGYKVYTNSPYNLYKSALNQGYKEFNSALNIAKKNSIQFDSSKDTFLIDGNVKIDTSVKEFDELTKYTYGYNLGIDVKNEKMQLGVKIDDNGKQLIELLSYFMDNKIYLKSEELYDKMISVPSEEDIDFGKIKETPIKSINYDDIDYVVKKLKDYITAAIQKDKLTKKAEEITINGEKVKVNNNSYNLDKDTYKAMIKSISNSIKNDKELLDKIANMAGVEVEEIKDFLDEWKDSDLEDYQDIIFNIYTKGFANTIVGFSIKLDGEEIIYYTDYNGITTFEAKEGVSSDDKPFMTSKCENDICNINILNVDTDQTIDLKVTKESDTKYSIDFELNGDAKADGTLKIDSKLENDKKVNYKIELEANLEVDGEKVNLKATIDNNLQIGSKIADINTSSAVDSNTLTSEDGQKILDNLENTFKGTVFYDIFESLMKSNGVQPLPEVNNNSSNTKCDLAFDCNNCVNGQCSCKYYDDNYNLVPIICPDKSGQVYY